MKTEKHKMDLQWNGFNLYGFTATHLLSKSSNSWWKSKRSIYINIDTSLTRGEGYNFQMSVNLSLSGKDITNNLKIKRIYSYFHINEARNSFKIPLVINSGKKAWIITKEKMEVIPISNYGNCQRLIFQARMNSYSSYFHFIHLLLQKTRKCVYF